VRSSTSTHHYGAVKLEFTVPTTYPKVPPNVKVAASEGLSSKDAEKLTSLVQVGRQ
jgi:hypothetical protein